MCPNNLNNEMYDIWYHIKKNKQNNNNEINEIE